MLINKCSLFVCFTTRQCDKILYDLSFFMMVDRHFKPFFNIVFSLPCDQFQSTEIRHFNPFHYKNDIEYLFVLNVPVSEIMRRIDWIVCMCVIEWLNLLKVVILSRMVVSLIFQNARLLVIGIIVLPSSLHHHNHQFLMMNTASETRTKTIWHLCFNSNME